MPNLLSNRKFIEPVVGLCLLIVILGFLVFPTQTAGAARDGIELCLDVLVPSLFPFFVLSMFMLDMGFAQYIGMALERVMKPVFNLSGPCAMAVAMGLLGGYPVGANTAIGLYEKGLCTKTETERLLSFCNNSGPAFVLGVVGAGLFANTRAGVILYGAHVLASLTVGFLFRFYRHSETPGRAAPPMPLSAGKFSHTFIGAVTRSSRSMANICAFVVIFAVVIKMLFLFGVIPLLSDVIGFLCAPFGLTANMTEEFFTGLLEVTSGLWSLQGSTSSLSAQLSMAAFMLGWAGLSVHCQVLSFIGGRGLKTWTYVVGKILHGILSAVYTFLLVSLFGLGDTVTSYLVEQVDMVSHLGFGRSVGQSLVLGLLVWLVGLAVTWTLANRRDRFLKR